MNEKRAMEDGPVGTAYGAPGSRAAERMDCPGTEWDGDGSRTSTGPALDEHVVEPETRWEVLAGSRLQASPALPPHADRHFRMDYVLGGHLAEGYVGATDLLTRWSSENDYATDTSIRRAGTDAATGERYLEEIAFEVAYTQPRAELETRARLLVQRGVRRVFAVFVKQGTVAEWSREDGLWRLLPAGAVIADPCLAQPLPVRALLDAAAADEAVARALVARRHPVIEEFGQTRYRQGDTDGYRRGETDGYRRGETDGYRRGETDGEANGLRRSLRNVLARRGLVLDARQRVRMEACTDPDMLDEWLCRAATATHADEIFRVRDEDEDEN